MSQDPYATADFVSEYLVDAAFASKAQEIKENAKTPVYQRMRNPITPPKAKPFNRPQIRVKEWRKRLDRVIDSLHMHPSMASISQLNEARSYADYLKEWIAYAEAILNDDADPKIPFYSRYRVPRYLGETCDPAHVHPVVKPEDFV